MTQQTSQSKLTTILHRTLLATVLLLLPSAVSAADTDPRVAHYKEKIEPVLLQYCFDCHGDGEKKGGLAFDEFKNTNDLLNKAELWRKVLSNVRAGIMPPPKKDQPPPEEKQTLAGFIKY